MPTGPSGGLNFTRSHAVTQTPSTINEAYVEIILSLWKRILWGISHGITIKQPVSTWCVHWNCLSFQQEYLEQPVNVTATICGSNKLGGGESAFRLIIPVNDSRRGTTKEVCVFGKCWVNRHQYQGKIEAMENTLRKTISPKQRKSKDSKCKSNNFQQFSFE